MQFSQLGGTAPAGPTPRVPFPISLHVVPETRVPVEGDVGARRTYRAR